MKDIKVILVGCGKMGSAMLGGWLMQGVSRENVIIIDPVIKGSALDGVTILTDFEYIPEHFTPDVVVLAVKPQSFENVVPQYAVFKNSAVFISIAAGKTASDIDGLLGEGASVVRAMPNLPATISKGVTASFCNEKVFAEQREIAQNILSAIGKNTFIKDESKMDAVTAISGSGPAYLFYFAEAMIEAAKEVGLCDKMAKTLVEETILGSAQMLSESEKDANELRVLVTSKGGTTQAALDVLMADDGIKPVVLAAVKAAKVRSIELS